MKKVAILGFGNFGQLLASFLRQECKVTILEKDEDLRQRASEEGFQIGTRETLSEIDVIFLAVPISHFESAVENIAPYVDEGHVVMDVSSVKVFPVSVMKKHLKKGEIIGLHPMFGPESAAVGIMGLSVAMCNVRSSNENFAHWSDFWTSLGCKVIGVTPEEHDREAAYSQALPYVLAKISQDIEMPELKCSTRSSDLIQKLVEYSKNDSDQLFRDMLNYNPYVPEMVSKLKVVFEKTTKEYF